MKKHTRIGGNVECCFHVVSNHSIQTILEININKIHICRSWAKLIWILVILIAFSISCWQLSDLIDKYLSHPVNMKINLKYEHLDFPSVRICNLNPIRTGLLHKDAKLEAFVSSLGEQKEEMLRDFEKWIKKVKGTSRMKRSIEDLDENNNDGNSEILHRAKRSAWNATGNITIESRNSTTPMTNADLSYVSDMSSTTESMTTADDGNSGRNETIPAHQGSDNSNFEFDYGLYGINEDGNGTWSKHLSEDLKNELRFSYYMSLISE